MTEIATRQYLYLTLRIRKKNNTLTKAHNRYIHKIKGQLLPTPNLDFYFKKRLYCHYGVAYQVLTSSIHVFISRTFLMTPPMFKENNLGI